MREVDAADDELTLLRSRVYGPVAASVSPAELERLHHLENVRNLANRGVRAFDLAQVSAPAPDDVGQQLSLPPPPPTAPSASHRWTHTWRRRVLIAAISIALVLVGFAAGVAMTSSRSTGSLPEFDRPQTDEDVVPVLTDGVLTPSTRYIARINGFDVYIALPAGYEGVCILTLQPDVEDSLITACGGGSVDAGQTAFRLIKT